MSEREQAASLRLADNLENLEATGSGGDYFVLTEWSQRRALEAASELRRLDAENKALMNLLRRAQPAQADRPCTCHPDDKPPVPCAQKYSLNECRAAQAVRAKMGAGVGWQPIETAPKTSKAILVYCAERKNIYTANYGKVGGFLQADGWRHFGNGGDMTEAPTHWQPLPPPPGIVGKEGA